jgi:hypothetical protein
MKRYTILFLFIVMFSCNNKKQEEETIVEETPLSDSADMNKPPEFNPDSKLYIWRSTADYKKEKNEMASPVIMNTDSLIKGLNEYYENVYLEKEKLSGDTLYTIIRDSKYLSQQMGSTGAEMYLADVILNLTTVPGVKYVKIEMEAGDHMQPGTWSAEDFKNYQPIIQ